MKRENVGVRMWNMLDLTPKKMGIKNKNKMDLIIKDKSKV